MSNKQDLQAINDYVKTRSAPAPGAPGEVVRKWEALKSQWDRWYPGVVASWYVSDDDVKHAKAIRNALMQNQNPDAWQWAQEGAADQPDKRKPWSERGDAPVSGKKPWERKGLTYSGKLKTSEHVKELQRQINAAGYQPPLKVDGKYGEGTKKGERWMNAQKPLGEGQQNVPAKKPDPAAQAVAMLGGPKPKPAVPATGPVPGKPTEKPVTPEPYRLLGVPVGIKSVVAAVAGTGAGWLAGGPIGAVVGIPVGWFGSKLIPEKKK